MKFFRYLFFISFTIILTACNSKSKVEELDHVILFINDLEKGMQQFEDMTGVKPVYGGVHPNSFTQNALVSLGDNTYLEIMAPRDGADSIPDWVNDIGELYPIGWAISTKDINSTQNVLSLHNVRFSKASEGSRKTPNGNTLKWSSFGIQNNITRHLPFFLKWNESSIHPSISSPKGCSLKSLKLYSNNESLKSFLKEMDIPCEVIESNRDSIILTINSPKGEIVFQ